VGVGALAGCQHNPTAFQNIESVPVVEAPQKQRCAAFEGGAAHQSCEDARYLAQQYVRRLAPGDEVCIEGGFGEQAGPACLARGSVVDVATNAVKIEVRQAQPGSRWFEFVMRDVWYQEGALVDLYLSERGY